MKATPDAAPSFSRRGGFLLRSQARRREGMLKQSGRAVLSPSKQPQAQSVIVVEQQSRSVSVETGRQLDRA
ncbi:hypothetical protein PC116_g13658 [Phytophthora cactorum]|nr:hypothetical protein PC117_g15685 [Phytophthora cactorum]KAG3025399.1 hypothetical protein PC120_g6507 [Phytophthora cactorum]KAG4238301.1 hypothetical protein PC116_g13658 [Phytophthora cactorum]